MIFIKKIIRRYFWVGFVLIMPLALVELKT